MPIYEQKYQPWSGKLKSHFWCVFSITRLGLSNALSKWSVRIIIGLSLIPLFIWLGLLMLAEKMKMLFGSVQIGNAVYWIFLDGQMSPWVWLLAAIAGAGLIANDLKLNALSMYFSKSITRLDYILGKLGTIMILLLMITLIPGTILFFGRVKQESDAADEARKEEAKAQRELDAIQQSGKSAQDTDALKNLMKMIQPNRQKRTFPTFWDHTKDFLAMTGQALIFVLPVSLMILAFSSLTKKPLFAALGWLGFFFITGMLSSVLFGIIVMRDSYEHKQQAPKQPGQDADEGDDEDYIASSAKDRAVAARGTDMPNIRREWPKLISISDNLKHLGRQLYPARPTVTQDRGKQFDEALSGMYQPIMRIPWQYSLVIVGLLSCASYLIISWRLRYIEGSE
jgi:hypothetical protein